MISIDDRIRYYIGDTKEPYVTPNFKKSGYDVPIEIDLRTYGQEFRTIHPNTAYPIDISRLGRLSTKHKLWFDCGDSPYIDYTWPMLVKIRDTRNKSSKGILANLNSQRHFGDIFRVKDTEWDNKKAEWIWRGADTSRGPRLAFVQKFKNKYDVGFADKYVQDGLQWPELYPPELLKPKVPMEKFLEYKYIPVVDGNDKSSSLGWVMASGSVPLMPKPRFHSWVCEPWLEAGTHYVEVNRDFSDLEEKIEWCKEHDQECSEIAENGKKFMMQFMNPLQEQYIEKQIIKYINNQNV